MDGAEGAFTGIVVVVVVLGTVVVVGTGPTVFVRGLGLDHGLWPSALMAATRNVYSTPFVRPVRVAEVEADTPSDAVVQVTPRLNEY